MRKELTDINKDDIRFLTRLPKQVGIYERKPVNMVYGPFGLYIKYDGRNVGLLTGTIMKLIKDPDGDHMEDLVKSIKYVKKEK
jgi:topoisomerase IA-like protein